MVCNAKLWAAWLAALTACTVSHPEDEEADAGRDAGADAGRDAGADAARDAGADAAASGGCDYGGAHHDAGASFPDTDGCNTCACSAGEVLCTNRACVDAGPGSLHWFRTCGAPVCGPGSDAPTGQPLCTTEMVGAACTSEGKLCDPGLGCGVNLVCAKSDPTMAPGGCPISRARYKEDIRYLSPAELSELATRLLDVPLVEWRYRADASPTPQLGFIIEDVAPSPSVSGDHVNLYGYASMAVAALKVQSQQLQLLESELSRLRARLGQLEQQCQQPAPRSARLRTP